MSVISAQSFSVSGDDISVDAELLAGKLGLTEKRLKLAMRRGHVTAEVQKGVDEDAGRMCVSFSYRRLRWVVMIEVDGQIIESVVPARDVPVRLLDPRLISVAGWRNGIRVGNRMD